ncbi:MAG: serine hydrolase domain-containing protein [Bacteroidales bacterium]
MKKLTFSFLLLLLFAVNPLIGQITTQSGKKISQKEMDKFIEKQMSELEIVGLSIALIKDGKVVYHKATGEKSLKTHSKVTDQSLFEAASMTKPVFAYVVHKLIGRGVLDLDTPLYKYKPLEALEYDKRHKLITARMVLNHTTGLPNWRPKGGKLELKYTPGEKYTYSGEAIEYLGDVVSYLLKKDLNQIMREELLDPIGMEHSSMVENDYLKKHATIGHKNGAVSGRGKHTRARPAHGLRTEAIEYSKFIIMMNKESHIDGSTFNRMAEPQVKVNKSTTSCLGLRLTETPYGPSYHHNGSNGGGRFQSRFLFYKDKDFGYVFFMNCKKQGPFEEALERFLK